VFKKTFFADAIVQAEEAAERAAEVHKAEEIAAASALAAALETE
jgi:hypothetical protein